MGLLVSSREILCAYMKVGIYGGPASGKTFTALKIATAIGNTAIIDTGREVEPLRDQFANPDGSPFLVGSTRDANAVIDIIDEAVAASCKCLIIDNVSTIYDDLQDDYIFREYEKNSKAWAFIEKNGNIPFSGWRFIKKPYKRMLYRLLNAPLHVFILSRIVDTWEVQGDGEPKKIGERMNAERDTQYEPQILIKMERDKKNPKLRRAWVERDRWKAIEGVVCTDPDVELLRPVLNRLGSTHSPMPPSAFDRDLAERRHDEPKSSQVILIKTLAKKGGVEDEVVEQVLGVITNEQAALVINEMTKGNMEVLRTIIGGTDVDS